ncbi:MAG: hypothetical protein JWO37_2167 [Acidimicrobiales bacterium]|jgi:hypothetical protein|nr:hypothetical protein [Acidimicrobiales bacterium]
MTTRRRIGFGLITVVVATTAFGCTNDKQPVGVRSGDQPEPTVPAVPPEKLNARPDQPNLTGACLVPDGVATGPDRLAIARRYVGGRLCPPRPTDQPQVSKDKAVTNYRAEDPYPNLWGKYTPDIQLVLFSDDVGGTAGPNGEIAHPNQNRLAWAITFRRVSETDVPSFGGGGAKRPTSTSSTVAPRPPLYDVVGIVDAITGKSVLVFNEGALDTQYAATATTAP